MASYKISQQAEEDLISIYGYSYQQFGKDKADAYYLDLLRTFDTLAQQPGLGRNRYEIAENLQGFAHQRHVIFYSIAGKNILIERIAGQYQDVPSFFSKDE